MGSPGLVGRGVVVVGVVVARVVVVTVVGFGVVGRGVGVGFLVVVDLGVVMSSLREKHTMFHQQLIYFNG